MGNLQLYRKERESPTEGKSDKTNMQLRWLQTFTGLLVLTTSRAGAAPAPTANGVYPLLYSIPNSDFTLFYKAITPGSQRPIELTVLISFLNSYLTSVIYPAMIERGAGASMKRPEDAYVKDLVAIQFKVSYTPSLPHLNEVGKIIVGMKGAAEDPRYLALEPADIVVFRGGVSRNVVAGLSLTVTPPGSNSSLSDIGSSDVEIA